MRKIILSKRLHRVAASVSPGNRVADVGTDHAYVPIWLVENGLIPSAIASDIREGPLERAREHICSCQMEKQIEARLGNGLDAIRPEEVDTVIMAGMGGDLISRLMQAHPDFFIHNKEWILQPQSEWFKVRHALHDLEYRIADEWMVAEEGHFYLIIRSLPGRERYNDEKEYRYGKLLLERKDPVLVQYLNIQRQKTEKILREMDKGYAELENIKETDTIKEKKRKREEQLREELSWMTMIVRAGR